MRRLLAIAALILIAVLLTTLAVSRRLHCLIANFDVRLIEGWECPAIGILEIGPEHRPEMATFGFTSPALDQKVDGKTRFNIASLSKQFTGMAIAILLDRGEIRLTDPISRYLPELEKHSNVTIANLLYQTSGFPDYLHLCIEKRPISNQVVLDFASESALEFLPGEEYDYINTGYVLLAIIVERVSGMPFAEFMQDEVFKPLGMERTSYYEPNLPDLAEPFVRPSDNPPSCDGIQGDGGVVTTLEDYAKWLLEIERATLISESTRDLMLTPGKLNDGSSTNYGFGWVITDEEIQHEGSWAGCEALVLYDRENRVWNAAFSNYRAYHLSRIVDRYWLKKGE